MKQYFIKGFVMVGIALVTVPAFAQKEKEKGDKERQTIVINRSGDVDVKTVIEITGDKVTINGKDVKENKDVSVNVHRFKDWSNLSQSPDVWNMHFDNNEFSLLTEDSNRAMLGVVTDENDKGAEISSVSKESAAEKAGLKEGDIVVAINKNFNQNLQQYKAAIQSTGDRLRIIVQRQGDLVEFELKVKSILK